MLHEKGVCIMGEMRKDRTPLEIMKKRAQELEKSLSIALEINDKFQRERVVLRKKVEEAEGELSIIKGMNRNEAKELQKKISDLLDKTDLIDDIDRFHKKFGFEKNTKVGIPNNPELINFRTSFLMEELSEYTNAIVKKDSAAALDALVDIVYIALGTAWLFNLPFDKAWKEIQAANMKKVRAKDTTGKRGTKFDVIKPKDFKEPNIRRIIEDESVRNVVKTQYELARDFLEEAEKEKKELNESYQESVRQTNERKE